MHIFKAIFVLNSSRTIHFMQSSWLYFLHLLNRDWQSTSSFREYDLCNITKILANFDCLTLPCDVCRRIVSTHGGSKHFKYLGDLGKNIKFARLSNPDWEGHRSLPLLPATELFLVFPSEGLLRDWGCSTLTSSLPPLYPPPC